MKPYIQQIALIIAILIGSISSMFFSLSENLISLSIILLLFFIFYGLEFATVSPVSLNKKYFLYSWIINFILIPILAITITTLFITDNTVLITGLLLYLLAPCTDWVLGFTKLARGNVLLNSILLPINLFSQILLVPLYLFLFSRYVVTIPIGIFIETLFLWIILPFVAARVLRMFFKKNVTAVAEWGGALSLIALLFFIFNSNFGVIIDYVDVVPILLLIIVLFFIIIYFVGKFFTKIAQFSREEMVSLVMTVSARNAPLMLGFSLIIFPHEPLIHAVLIVGMLFEFPHLILLTYLSKR